jgi:hypothetical protein
LRTIATEVSLFVNTGGNIIDYANFPDEGVRGGMPKAEIADLKTMDIKIMNHGNNHTVDFGSPGTLQTNALAGRVSDRANWYKQAF